MSLPEGDGLLLLHNPRCSKSRSVHELLTERGVAFEERRYLETPLSRDELEQLQRRLGRPVSEWTRTGESAFEAAGLGPDAPDAKLLDALASAPILMERPILVSAERAVVGRPPDAVLELL